MYGVKSFMVQREDDGAGVFGCAAAVCVGEEVRGGDALPPTKIKRNIFVDDARQEQCQRPSKASPRPSREAGGCPPFSSFFF